MPQFEDLTGQRFGRLTVVSRAPNRGRATTWNCLCDCGNEVIIRACDMKSGRSRSCGCFRKEENHRRFFIHGMKGSGIYTSWCNMVARCENPKKPEYPQYGGRGIKVCNAWRSFEAFYADMAPTYCEGLTLERRDTDGDYSPENCCWATRKEQTRNRRCTYLVDCPPFGRIPLAGLAEKTGIGYGRLRWRSLSGKPLLTVEERINLGIPEIQEVSDRCTSV